MAELKWRMSRTAREWDELTNKIENKAREIIEGDQEAVGIERMLREMRNRGN